jgi:hypothetical protein
MCSLIRKSAVLLSVLTLISLATASAELKKVPLILMDRGTFSFTSETTANLEGTGVSTHLGKIVSTGVFENVQNRPSGGFKGKIEGTATAVLNETATATTATPTTATPTTATPTTATPTTATPTPIPSPIPDAITYRLSAEFRPGEAPGIFYGVGTYRITGGTGKFEGARGFGEFIGLADFDPSRPTYNCFLRGAISY